VNHVPAHQPVGYQGTYVTNRASRLGLVPIGHADGYPFALSNRGIVRVGPGLHPAPVRGEVNMDQLIVDLTEVPEAEATVGSEVELIASDPEAPNALDRLAARAGSSCYELLCRLSPRVPRRYLGRDREPRPEPVVREASAPRRRERGGRRSRMLGT
jgi:alanine racemase